MLLRNHQPLIDSVAIKSIRSAVRRAIAVGGLFHRHEEDDLAQEISLRLLRRIEHFNPTLGSWSTFCRVNARNYLADEAKRRIRQLRMTSLHETHQDRRGKDYVPEQVVETSHSYTATLPTHRPQQEQFEFELDLHGSIEQLDSELQLVCATYLQLRSVAAVAEQLQRSRTSIYRYIDQIRVVMSNHSVREYRWQAK